MQGLYIYINIHEKNEYKNQNSWQAVWQSGEEDEVWN
jgi:hypothetical protein